MMKNRALFIIDVQKGQIRPEQGELIAGVESLQDEFDLIAVFSILNPEGSPWRRWIKWGRFGPDDPGRELAFTPAPHAMLFDKPQYSALLPEVQGWLDENAVDEVHLCGVRTENCILATAVDLFQGGKMRPVVRASYCGSPYPELHDAGLKILEKFIGKDQIVYD